jgi:hypothetical protein
MTEELKVMGVVVVVVMEEVVVVVVVVGLVMVKLGVMVTEPWPVLYPLSVAVDGNEPPPPPGPQESMPPPLPPPE